jgi:hypothetical protein
VRVLLLPNLPEKGDLTNWIDAGGTVDEFWRLVAAAPNAEERFVPTQAASEPEQNEVSGKPWPTLLKQSNYGLVGELGALATRDSEADPIAVMATSIAWGAAVFGRSRFMGIGDTHHHPRHFCALVGASSRARKGTSLDPVKRVFKAAETELRSTSTLPFPSGLELKISNGPLSSGEGLINAIRDKRDDEDTGGVQDKRLLCIEGEFGAVLRSCQRQGNTLSSTLRVAWDGSTLEPLTKHDRVCATDPHICIVGHITRHELNELMSVTDIWNGFANRFLWFAVRRRAQIPFPKAMPENEVARIATELARVVRYAHSKSGEQARMVLSNSAQAHWADCYSELTAEHTGILGAVTSRAEAQTLRLAMTFALFDGADRIDMKHLEAALSFWRYAFDSAEYIFGDAELDTVARQILEALKSGPKTQTEIWNHFQRNLKKDRLNGVLSDLQERGRITLVIEKTSGAPKRVWGLTNDRRSTN